MSNGIGMHALDLWYVLFMEGYVRHRQHLEVLAITIRWEARNAPR